MLRNPSKLRTQTQGTQKLIHGNYMQDNHDGKDDWQFTIMDYCTTYAELRKVKVYYIRNQVPLYLWRVKPIKNGALFRYIISAIVGKNVSFALWVFYNDSNFWNSLILAQKREFYWKKHL